MFQVFSVLYRTKELLAHISMTIELKVKLHTTSQVQPLVLLQPGNGQLCHFCASPGPLPPSGAEQRRSPAGAAQLHHQETQVSVHPFTAARLCWRPLCLTLCRLSAVAFQLYDQDGDGKISREELLQVGSAHSPVHCQTGSSGGSYSGAAGL